MPVTLESAKKNATDDLDLAIIDEFRTNDILDLITFDDVVNPAGGGGTLTYGYRRLATLSNAAFRAINSEYTPNEVTTTKHFVELKPLGGAFQIDRVLAKVGAAATGEVSLQMGEKIRATRAEFGNAVINGDTGVDEDSFDGLSKALAGTSTEDSTAYDWSASLDDATSFQVLEDLDNILGMLDGDPTIILSNKRLIARAAAAARRAGMYTAVPNAVRPNTFSYGGIRLVDAGKKAGTNEDVIPITDGVTELYAIRFGLDAFHGVSMSGVPLVQTWLPDFSTAGAVKTGEVEMGPVGVVLKKTKAAAVARNVRVAVAAG